MSDAAGAAPRPPRTLLVADALFRTGATRVVLSLLERWGPGSGRLAVLGEPPGPSLLSAPPGAPVQLLSGPGQRLRATAVPSLLRLVALARRHEVVLATSEIGPGVVLAWLAARLARRPFVVSVHADLDDALAEWVPAPARPLLRLVHRRADAAVCVDAGVAGPVLANGLPPHRLHVVRNGVDLAAVRAAAAAPPRTGTHQDGDGEEPLPVVVATGRLAPQKGYDLLLRAHAAVVRRVPHRLRVLNDGPELAALQALAAELGVTASVDVAGAVEAPLPEVARADLFCLPSRHEGLPLALIEAVALGVPCLISESSEGVREVLDGGRTGQLVPVGDVAALAAALEAHLVDPHPLRAKAAAGLRHVEQFDVSAMAAGWAAALHAAVDGRGRRRGTHRRAEGASGIPSAPFVPPGA
ncbi:glycosyltransferase [Streptomyces sp. NP160]|uniref:glycosyltransferase n=1 Tax=Streptomyces sp. NP160 TaxID=2586637 RepID=UPI00111A58AE|nr:glycosyltransferase [Streptomyces sp. NP160]TNM67424.1 glycosyltransferase [Streptomyces sp. NP160]